MNKKCWDYLINIQKFDSSFYFVPRRINNLNRLEQGYFFIGNEEYMQISFWDGGDRYEKVHNVSWGVEANGKCFIEISSKDKPDRANYLAELVNILEQKTGKSYHGKNGKWHYYYPEDIFYLDTLQGFLDDEKLIIDEYLRKNPETGIAMLNQEFNEKFVLKLLYQKAKNVTDENTKKKLEGFVSVSPSSYLMALQHNELQNAMVDYLKNDSKNKSVRSEVNNVDIAVETVAGERVFYELKTSDVKQAIRLAFGQLLEYCHYSNKTKADKLIVVTKYVPDDKDIVYLNQLRSLYQIPIYYQQFDMEKKELVNLY